MIDNILFLNRIYTPAIPKESKFFKFLHESQRIDEETKDEVYLTLKQDRDEFLDAVACDDEDF